MSNTTMIIKNNHNELVKFNLKFRVINTKGRVDIFIHETYQEAKSRLATLQKIFKYSNYEIIVYEGGNNE